MITLEINRPQPLYRPTAWTIMDEQNQILQQIESQVAELHKQSLATMNARYDEFDSIDDDYPDGPIGDPESLTNEAFVRAYNRVLVIIRNLQWEADR